MKMKKIKNITYNIFYFVFIWVKHFAFCVIWCVYFLFCFIVGVFCCFFMIVFTYSIDSLIFFLLRLITSKKEFFCVNWRIETCSQRVQMYVKNYEMVHSCKLSCDILYANLWVRISIKIMWCYLQLRTLSSGTPLAIFFFS